ncbi:DUF2577 family protein [Metaclostridioides mangenotii]|uniref:DUF2577 family protein n=1 Tax=Metaclostridioides mangenotii TaxID=1540 RepID=UPI002E8DFD9A|nr:DUF2577 family protein [Clostridioides mangenotii]
MIAKPEGKPTLVSIADKRPEINSIDKAKEDSINELVSFMREAGKYYNYNPIQIGRVRKINPLEIDTTINASTMTLYKQNLQINSHLNISNEYMNTTLSINDEVLMYHRGEKFIIICKVVDA